ncbi:MAG: hypothetical protein ACREF9_00010 [Opitutaceae bacterium]
MAINTNGSNRDQLIALETDRRNHLINAQVLVGDPRRWRPRWFDGRFLAASDLLAEQNYFLVRQADLGRAAGSGIIDGLGVTVIDNPGDSPDQLDIAPGYGVSDTGELVTLLEPLRINPADVPEMRRLDAAFGLQVIPTEPGQTRTGLYVLALRPVEWSANPIGAYPTSLTGQRTVEDGTIVEGVAVSLIPYPDQGNEETWERRRARVAREIFVDGRDRGFDSGVLPLAMVALRGNLVEWMDPYLVRRETGAERPAGMDFGFGNRALREAHLLQYQRHLADTLDAQQDAAFAAAAQFDALPPVGRFPAGTISADRLTQRFFPPGIEVDLSFVPEDELPALIEESLLLPPIDLTLTLEQLNGTGVVVLVPLTRAQFTVSRSSLPDWNAQPLALRPAFVKPRAIATPKELLLGQRFRADIEIPTAPTSEDEPWRVLLRSSLNQPLLWYVRRRHLPISSNVAATPVDATNGGDADLTRLASIVREDTVLNERFTVLREANIPETSSLTRRLAETRIVENPAMLRSLVARASTSETGAPTAASVVSALAPATDPQLGTGLVRMAATDETLVRRLEAERITDTGLLAEVDKLARDVPEDQLPQLATELREVIGTRGAAPATLATDLTALRQRFVKPTP